MKIEREFRFEGETLDKLYEANNIMCFMCRDSYIVIVTDLNMNVLFKVTADCTQNTGFLNFKKIK